LRQKRTLRFVESKRLVCKLSSGRSHGRSIALGTLSVKNANRRATSF
jgi:hypothetical protein